MDLALAAGKAPSHPKIMELSGLGHRVPCT